MNRAPSGDSRALRRALERLYRYHPKKIDLSLARIERLLAALGNPHLKLPPVFHVAGTNGKGSVVAYLRAFFEAAGLKVHVYTSPHLVRFNERIRVAGKLIEDRHLIECIEACERANAGGAITFFELTTAAAFLAFSQTRADVCLLEVGLGGRLDATNVIERPLASVIAPVGLDHAAFLGDEPRAIAREKAGIAKADAPLVVARQQPEIMAAIRDFAEERGARVLACGEDWRFGKTREGFTFSGLGVERAFPRPNLPGPHQTANAALALAALKAQRHIRVADGALEKGLTSAQWPARFQPLDPGRFKTRLAQGSRIWLDGGHNPLAAAALKAHLEAALDPDMPFYLVAGMIEGKDARGFLSALAPLASGVFAVPVPGKESAIPPGEVAKIARGLGAAAAAADNPEDALAQIAKSTAGPVQVLITGSLYLSGAVLKHLGIAPQ